MAKGAQKRVAIGNDQAKKTLFYGFLVSNTIFFLSCSLWRSTLTWRTMALYAVSEGVAAALGMQLWTMSRRGEDLSQAGLTAYMFDVIYITWFVHITTALLSRYFWWTFALIPMYALYLFYAKILEPFVLRGRRMNRTAVAAPSKQATDSTTEPGLSKRQAKLQARQKRGTRVQMRRG